MSEDKKIMATFHTVGMPNSEIPVAIPKKTGYRKYVVIAVSAVVTVAIVLTAILVGIHIFASSQAEIVKYTLGGGNDMKSEVKADPNTNVVQYHLTDASYEEWVVDDFNRDIRVAKLRTKEMGVNCYVTPLNRSVAADPTQISDWARNKNANSTTITLYYTPSDTPIPDSSFLPKAAKNMCTGISTYWLFPQCDGQSDVARESRTKRKLKVRIRVRIRIKRRF